MRSLFFAREISEPIVLDGEEGHHAADVVRVRVNEEIDISDNKRWVHAKVTAVTRGRVEAEIIEELTIPAAKPSITVAQGVVKGDALSESVDVMTQVGVHRIIPWFAERSVVHWDAAKAQKNVSKLQTQAVEASKQARRPQWPTIDLPMTTSQLISEMPHFDRVVVLHESGEEHLADDDFNVESILMIVGPEGGLSPAELEDFANRAVIRRLGPTVIRSAQAAAIASAVVFAKRSWRKA